MTTQYEKQKHKDEIIVYCNKGELLVRHSLWEEQTVDIIYGLGKEWSSKFGRFSGV